MTKKVDIMICPYCNSDNVVKKKQAGYTFIFSILLLGLPLPFFRMSYYCFDCEKEWKKNDI
jgi:DNA-directed RNA polymerase subunit RPC12/RpoP